MNHITYFKFKSPYENDLTKNCSLSGSEVDANFYTLESRDIKSVKVNEKDLVITLYDGTELVAEKALENFASNLSFSFDSLKGELTINKDGVSQVINGFLTKDNYSEYISQVSDVKIYADSTMTGNGSKEKPLSLSNNMMTGKYKPADKYIDASTGHLPSVDEAKIGERIVTFENVDTYGYLYDFNAILSLNKALQDAGSQWRVPTKEDWDDMLNSLEVEKYRNHNELTNGDFGAVAGKKLKSENGWETLGVNKDNYGIDLFNMNVLPCGYVDEYGNYQYDKKIAWFWSSTENEIGSVFSKRFDADKSTVHQKSEDKSVKLSVRLVKEFDGSNFEDYEHILGTNYKTTLLPSVLNKHRVWTSENLIINLYNPYKPVSESETSNVKKYFINEWNGTYWERKELSEGESIVIKQSELSQDKNQEFIITDGKLVLVSKTVYDNVLAEVSTKTDVIDAKLVELEQGIDNNKTNISSLNLKTDATNTQVEELKNKVNSIELKTNANTSSIEESNRKISTETSERKAETTKLKSDVEQLTNDNTSNKQRLSTLEGKVTNAEGKITVVETKVSDLEDDNTKNKQDILGNTEKITKEILDRKNENALVKADIKKLDDSSIIKEGSTFDSKSGVLILKTKSELEEDINVQMSFNFGDF